MIRLSLRATVLGGVAIGLTAGAAVYSALSPSAMATSPTAFMVPRAPVTVTRVTPAPANPAPCAAGSKLQKGVCVVKVVRTVVVPAPVAPSNPGSGQSEAANSATSGNGAGPSHGAGPERSATSINSATSGRNASLVNSMTPRARTTSGTHRPAPTEKAGKPANDAAERADESAKHPDEQADEHANQAHD